MTIVKLINEFKKNNSMLWVEANNIKLFVADEFDDRNGILDTIKKSKPEIVNFLTANKIFSKEDFQKKTIFKSDANEALLSFAQQRLWFIELYEQGSNAYHIPLIIELDADTDTAGVKFALQQIVSRHEVLRTTIEHGDSQEYGIQRVHEQPLLMEEITLTDKQDVKSLIREDINRPFDLSTEYPIRVKFYTIQSTEATTEDLQNRCILLINFHHIASDGWSIEIFQKEWAAYYDAYTNNNTGFCLPPLEIQYKDYAVWQRSYLSGEILEKQLSYWKDKLSGYQTLELPTDYARPGEVNYSGASEVFKIDREVSQKLRVLAQHYGVTLHSVLLSSINILLSKYTGQEDIITGSVIANRHHRQTEGLIGFFVNTQVNRTITNRFQSFADLVQQVHQDQVEAQSYQDLPFEKLVEELGVERDPSRHPVFQVMFGIESFGSQPETNDEQKAYQKPLQAEITYNVEKFDLSINIDDSREELMVQISYATALFHKDSVERLIRHYTYLLAQLTEAPEKPYSQHSLLRPQEYHQIIHDWNATATDYPEEKTIYQLFQEQAAKTPDNIALVYEGQQLSYKQLNEKSNQLARHIRKQYLQKTNKSTAPDTLTVLYLDRGLEMVIGILAVLKSGGAYVPMDIYYPQERIDYILEDTQATLILSQRQLSKDSHTQLPPDNVLYIDLAEEFYTKEDSSNLSPHSKATDLAYLIYTSGSTGKPKAVAIEHKSVVNMALSRVVEYKMSNTENSLQIASICFDASVEQIFVALFSGAKLTLIKKEILADGEKCELFLNENKITHLDTVPSFLETLDFSKLKYLKRIASGGESCTVELVNRILPYIEFYNEYGPTEATVITTQYKIEKGKVVSGVIPIGKPIHNAKIFILDNYLSIVPAGIVGEIYIGGECLARGYLNNDKLTAEKFILNPFGEGRLYKTGDLGRWRNDGQIEYTGRKDNQVKIRGFRIELGEIEHALSQIKGIRHSCVLVKERETASGSIKYLVGYYVPDKSEASLNHHIITDKLSQVLPEYMVPAILVAVESFPLTINGKLDKRALPDPDFSDETNYIKPNTELETRLCQVYAEVLGLASDQISTHQNFFRMGGNSILSIQLKAKLNRLNEFKHISVADLFKYNSINKLIQSIQKDVQTEYRHPGKITQSNDHEIAIIGVSGAFSGANNVAELWQVIVNQREGIHFYSREECIELGMDETLLQDPAYIPVEGKVEDMDLFDPSFWEMSPNEARQMDPQIRKFVEHCWFALESSGYAHQRKNQHIGVFAGSGSSNYFYDHILHAEMADQINMWEASNSNSKDALATKTAWLLDLSGPANSINTACSTGLVSVVEACKNLQLGTCNMALAGGVSLLMPYQIGYIYEEGMILSKDGHCKTFDSEASGTTGASGVGVVLLKRLGDAIKDGDTILGIVKGYATNNDGARKTGYTAPSLIGQSECIISARTMAGISADQIDYVECHGTATHLGDPIEVQALKEAFQYNQPKENLTKHTTVLGAIKANIGHADSAAGTAGLIKVIAMLQHNIIPGQVNYNEPNPELHLDQTSFEIIKENRAWPASLNRQRLAGVSSFGIGGTNAHVIIGDYVGGANNGDEIREMSFSSNGKETGLPFIIPVSARSRQSLEYYKQALFNYLTEAKESSSALRMEDIVYTLQERRDHFNFRTAFIAPDIDGLINQISHNTSYSQINTEGNNRIVFMFPGQGAQYTHMAKFLYNNEPFFRNIVTGLVTIANQHLAVDLSMVMYPLEKATAHDINETQWSQISLFIIEYALAKYLAHLGFKAAAYIGHSIGEYVSAALSGIFTVEDAIRLVIARGKLMQSMQPGSMLAINAGEETLKPIVQKYNCEIAVINSPEDTVVSGEDEAIKVLKTALDSQDIASVILNTSHAYHSKLMDEAAREFEKIFEDITLNKPTHDFVSNVTGEIAGEEVTTAGYWCKQLRNTVQFAKGISCLSKQYNHQVSFIEVGTGKGLCSFVNKHKNTNNYRSILAVQLLPSEKQVNATEDKATGYIGSGEDIMAILWMNGIISKPNDVNLFAHAKIQPGLPVYQFNNQKCWIERSELKDVIKFNSIDEMFYERSWERVNLKISPSYIENIKHKNILILINDTGAGKNDSMELVALINSHCSNTSYVIHQQANDLKIEDTFDFGNAMDIDTIFKAKNEIKQIETVIYISPAIDINDPGLDIHAVRNIFNWSKNSGNKIPEFISISFDNYEVTGTEVIQDKPSIMYGVTKSVPFEYFSSGTKTIHIDLSCRDKSGIAVLLAALYDNEEKDLIVIRGKYQWFPTYQQVKFPHRVLEDKGNLPSEGTAYLITGGLGALGYAYADHLAKKEGKCTIIILGRTNESKLRKDYKTRLNDLKMTGHNIIYSPIDIGSQEALPRLREILTANNINNIEVALHAAGVAAKSALNEKTHNDIAQVINPKITGTENLIDLSAFVHINNLVCCSSVSSILPSLGNMEYTAANLYLDEMSYRNHPGVNYMVAINLNQISDSGMAVDFMGTITSDGAMSPDSIKSQEFPFIVEMLLQNKTVRNIVLSRYDFNDQFSDNFKILAGLNDDLPEINNAGIKIAEDNYTETEYKIALIFGAVLGIEEISIHDDFFRIGGNSISAIQVSHRMSHALGCDVRVADVFRYKTISQLIIHSIGQIQTEIPRAGEPFVLSFAQERLWFIEQYEQGSNAYHLPAVYELDADTDPAGIKYALQQIVSRHEVLRTTIEHGDSQEHGIQRVHDEPLPFEEVTLPDKEDVGSMIAEDINRPFDLTAGYPVRIKFYNIRSGAAAPGNQVNKTLLLINFHHIASDGWSTDIFERELYAYYEAYINNDTGFCFPPLEIQYKDYAVWQRKYLTGEILEKQLSYWKDKLSRYQTLELPTDYARPGEVDYSGASGGFIVDAETSQKLRALAQRYGVTLHSVMLSSISILLSKYTGQEDIITGSVSANRHHRQTEDLIGFFVNTQVNRTLLNKTQSFEDLVQQVQQEQVQAQLYQDLPFEKLVEELGVERDPSRHPVFQVMVGVQSFGNQEEAIDEQKNYLTLVQTEEVYEVEKFDLSIFINDSRQELMGQISYATALFHKDTIERLIRHYTHLLEQLTEAPELPYSQHSLLSPEEYEQIIYDWNDTDKDYPKEKTIYQLFQEQAEKAPDNIALVYEGQQLTYKQLNEKSNQLARHIREQYQQRTKQPLAPDTLIALYLDRSPEMVIGILAVLKAGGAYVPIDINYPRERIDYILEDTGAALILSHTLLNKDSLTQLPPDKVIYINSTAECYKNEDNANLVQHSKPSHLAYVIYTSGTTGQPKGVMIEQAAVLSLVFNDYIKLSGSDVFAFLSSPVFDATTFEIWTPLLNGNTLVIPNDLNDLVSDINAFKEFIAFNNISVLWLTKTLFESLFHVENGIFKDLNYLITGGEALDRIIVKKLMNSHTKPKHFLNGYGPTESTTFTCIYDLSKPIVTSNVPIGTPIKNRSAYVLYSNLDPVPVGITGELYIGGAGVARGYLNQKELTEERFIENPFATELDRANGYTRLYKTGDLVRWLPDGNLEYMGRNDDQVKIRGFRIELGEIEHVLSQIKGIRQSCVLAKERTTASGSTKYLVGYYVPDKTDASLNQTIIADKLSQVLPEYMIPGAFVEMGSLPFTTNGKLDKRALPDPAFISPEEEYIAPTTETEAAICNIWQEALGLERVGITDNFFKIGGNSILAIHVSHQMSKALEYDVKVADVFKYKTISQLLTPRTGQVQIIIPRTHSNHAVLSFAQERLWFIEQYEQGTNAYHIPEVLELDPDTNIAGIKYALQQIVSRHEVLRTTIEHGDSQEHGIQRVHDEPLSFEEVTLTDKEDVGSLIAEDINRPFDLTAGYPVRIKFYNIWSGGNQVNKTLLLINFHHIASDGWSTDIFERELYTYYQAYINNDTGFCLPPLEIQYKDYAVWQRKYLTGEILEKQLSYWKDKLSGYQTLELPTDYARPGEVDYSGASGGFIVDAETSQKLRALAQRYGVTLHSVMLSSISILLSKYTGQEDIITGSPIANRHHRQTEDLIGFFVNTQVNRTLLSKTQSYEDLVQQVHQEQVQAQLYQDLPFEKLVDKLGVERDPSRHPVFQVMFSVQSFGNQEEAIDDQKNYLTLYQAEEVYEVEKFDLSIFINDSRQKLMGQISYATALFHKDTIERLIRHYTYLLEQLTEAPELPYSQHSLLSPEEYEQVVYDWNDTDKGYPKEKTIYQLFQEQAEKTSDNIALVYEGQQLTYKQLNEKSNQLARHIREQYQQQTKQPLAPDTLIALYLDRSLEMVIAILAVMKAGGAYVPMDINYPQERINYLLAETGAELILSQKHAGENNDIQLPGEKVIHIDLSAEFYNEEDTADLPQHSTATDLACVLFTSGTTGKPKGVMLEHSTVYNRVLCMISSSGIISSDHYLFKTNYVFDVSLSDIFTHLCAGAKLQVTKYLFDLNEINDLLSQNEFTSLHLVPSQYDLVSTTINKLNLQKIYFSGEALTERILAGLDKNIKVYNYYGPTETGEVTVVSPSLPASASVIGKPFSNCRQYVLDQSNNPVPIGVRGELYIGGACLARGYLNRPDLTEDRFISNPFATEADKEQGYTRLYKTGDLVRWLPDGNLEYIGRNDDQVKINGYRIELGEIEHALSQITGIRQSCVLARERETAFGPTKYLVGYYVSDNSNGTLSQTIITDKLSQVLPEYMVPDAFVEMGSFPLTTTGKLDKKAFPDADFQSSMEEYVAPSSDTEEAICKIWQEALGLQRVGITDNFFRIGGNSILAIQVSHKMSKSLGCDVKVADVFKLKNIQMLLENVSVKKVHPDNVEWDVSINI